MAQNTSLEGLRSQLLTSIFGRRLALSAGNAIESAAEYLVGPRDLRVTVGNVSSAGSTVVSTAVATALPPYGVSLVGATAASATTGYILSAPVPGVRKLLFCPTTGYAVITVTTDSTGAGAGTFVCSTGSATSTYQMITLSWKGASVELIGLTTNLWGANMGPGAVSSVSTGVNFV